MIPMQQFTGLDDETIRREILSAGHPAVLRGLVSHWPAVAAALESSAALVAYLRNFDNGGLVDAVMTPPEVAGRIFYKPALDGFNFLRNRLPLSGVAEQALRYASFPHPPAVAAQSALIRDCIPGFSAHNALPLLNDSVLPRIWLGNAITTPTHVDEWCNIACVVGGRRRFTLFPPEQIANLYIGPIDYAPTGAPMSLVELAAPDLERYPRFPQALAAAQSAELGPGDAIFIPPLWWHHVESLNSLNVLVNYWWHATSHGQHTDASAFDCLMHCILNMRDLPPVTRRAWGALFEQYVFGANDAVTAHIPANRLGILGKLSTEDRARLRAHLAKRLSAGS
jgi:Cupin-like domain